MPSWLHLWHRDGFLIAVCLRHALVNEPYQYGLDVERWLLFTDKSVPILQIKSKASHACFKRSQDMFHANMLVPCDYEQRSHLVWILSLVFFCLWSHLTIYLCSCKMLLKVFLVYLGVNILFCSIFVHTAGHLSPTLAQRCKTQHFRQQITLHKMDKSRDKLSFPFIILNIIKTSSELELDFCMIYEMLMCFLLTSFLFLFHSLYPLLSQRIICQHLMVGSFLCTSLYLSRQDWWGNALKSHVCDSPWTLSHPTYTTCHVFSLLVLCWQNVLSMSISYSYHVDNWFISSLQLDLVDRQYVMCLNNLLGFYRTINISKH